MADEAKVAETKKKKVKKLAKGIEGTVVTIVEASTGTNMKFDAATLPKEIQAKLMPYGLSQKLGDAAAGKSGKEAVDSIDKVWEGLMKNDWTTRAPAAEKINKKDVLEKFAGLDPKAKAALAGNPATKAILEALGVKF